MPPMKGQFQFRHEYVYLVMGYGTVHSVWRTQSAAKRQTAKTRVTMGRRLAKDLGLTWVRKEVLD